MATFPSIQPTYGMRKKNTPRERFSSLGDGYEFKTLFGIKFKGYLGATYEIFRNKSVIPLLNYKPTEQAVKKKDEIVYGICC